MLNYLGARLFTALIVVFGVVTIVFMLIHIVPGDPVEVMLGESAQVADREALRETLGLNLPLSTQWVNYINGLLHFDLGTSLYTKRPVIDVLTERIPATSLLAGTSILISLIIALPLGVLAAVRKGSLWDRFAMTFSMLGVAIPNFWMGPLLILVFSLWLGWFPVSGNDQILSLVLPAVTLGTALAAILSRMVRASLLEVFNEDYIRAANARGLLPSTVIWKHALKNAALPVVTILGMQLGALLAGAVITETVFSWPGVGQLTIDAIQKRDYPVIQSCVLLISLSYVFINLLTDLAYAYLDPRVSLSG